MAHSELPGLQFQSEFFLLHPCAESMFRLFEHLPHVYFYAKDVEHRYVGVNHATLAGVFGLSDERELLGRTDTDFQPPALAEAYHQEDRRVMDGGKIIPNQVWLVPHVRGTPRWYVSTKTPLSDPAGEVIGLAGVMYPIETPEAQRSLFRELSPVIDHIDRHYAKDIAMHEMAQLAGLSVTQFNARFKEILRMSPSQYVLSRRIEHARRLVTDSSKSLTEIADEVGFFDQSHFTKRFRRVTGMTPRQYRTQFRKH